MPKRRLQTTLSDEAFRIIEKYKEKYGNINEVLEEALRLLDRKDKSLNEDDLLLISLIQDLDFTGCGRSQYMYLILGDKEKAIEESMMETAVEWFLKKPFPEIELEEFLETVRRGWKILNRVDYVEITKGENWIQFFCEHTMRRREVSEFLARHILNIYEKYYREGWKVVKSVSTNGFTLKFYRKE
ncbi:hypothetical protein [Archaeoglobus neptunius]|uniref:hypothetical protein n=1 Tax=Archaeoglobus neptunius TaxID=2798580 RepID=UPI001929746D|nr:hypothetical protein [Archaeoglobus neptunius]